MRKRREVLVLCAEGANRRSRILKTLWANIELCVVAGVFLILLLTNTFWIAVLPPYGYVLWPIVAQIIYWWAEPIWRASHPRVTKSMLKGEIAELRHRLSRKNIIIKGYFKAVVYHQEEIRRLKNEIKELSLRYP